MPGSRQYQFIQIQFEDLLKETQNFSQVIHSNVDLVAYIFVAGYGLCGVNIWNKALQFSEVCTLSCT